MITASGDKNWESFSPLYKSTTMDLEVISAPPPANPYNKRKKLKEVILQAQIQSAIAQKKS